MSLLTERVLRPGRDGPRERWLDVLWLVACAVLLVASGIGLRDPWPADEPRFVLIARDMVATGNWLIPMVGGDFYPDKPPLFFWLIAAALWIVRAPRVAFLLPSLLAAAGCVVLVYDLARRFWDRGAGLAAGFALLGTIQFVWQARQAQIDATLCFWTTLSLYGLLRHLALGPAWRWYAIGWAAAGLGIITKGVGFLPLLVFVPYALMRGPRWNPRPQLRGGWRWTIGPLAVIGVVSLWLVPMLLASAGNPELARYRDEILFRQTIDRYTQAWQHQQPFWYYAINVIPLLWLPLTALVPWLWGRWRDSLRSRDLRVCLPLAWVLLVVLFFSLSSGKRGVYVLPALPALALACAPHLTTVLRRRGARLALAGIPSAVAVVTTVTAFYLLLAPSRHADFVGRYGIEPIGPLLTIGIGCGLVCLWSRARRAVTAYAVFVTIALLVVSYWVIPVMNEVRSGRRFVRQVEAMVADGRQLGLVGYREEHLLYLRRPTVSFGHARRAERPQEAADAATWLVAGESRSLLVTAQVRGLCFADAAAREVGMANGERWYFVVGPPDRSCVNRGDEAVARLYTPPAARARPSVGR